MSWVLEAIRGLRPTERLVLLILANYADAQNATCWPSLNKIADQCEVRKDTVKKALRRLEAADLIERDERFDRAGRQTSNLYILKFITTTDQDKQGGEKALPGRVKATLGRGAKKTPLIPLNRQSNHQKKKGADSVEIPENLRTKIFELKWGGWLDYRRQVKHKPVSSRAAEMQLKKLSKFGPAVACATIDKSIENDWQGLFPEKIEPERTERSKRPKSQLRGAGAWT